MQRRQSHSIRCEDTHRRKRYTWGKEWIDGSKRCERHGDNRVSVTDHMLHSLDSPSLSVKFSIDTGMNIISLHVFNRDYLVIGSDKGVMKVYKVTETEFEKIGEAKIG